MQELSPLAPTATEIALTAAALAHVGLVVAVLVAVARGRFVVPYGVPGYLLLLLVPVVGPLLLVTLLRSGGAGPAGTASS